VWKRKTAEVWLVLLTLLIAASTVYFAVFTRSTLEQATLFLLWEPQAQFLGYYVAENRGFFRDEGIQLSIRHDLAVGDSMKEILRSENNYVITQFVNVAEWLSHSPKIALLSVISKGCNLGWLRHKSDGQLDTLLTQGRVFSWWGPHDILLRALLAIKGKKTTDLDERVTTDYIRPLPANSVALVMLYNEALDYAETRNAEFVSYCDLKLGFFEDVLVGAVPGKEKQFALHQKMVRAIWKGWDWSIKHPTEAIDILMKLTPRKARREQEIQLERFSKTLMATEDSAAEYSDRIENVRRVVEASGLSFRRPLAETLSALARSRTLRSIEMRNE